MLKFDKNKDHLVFNKEKISFSLIEDLINNRKEDNNNTKITSNDITTHLRSLEDKKTNIKNDINHITNNNIANLSFLDEISLTAISKVQKLYHLLKVILVLILMIAR